MGRLNSLLIIALGRSPFEDKLLEPTSTSNVNNGRYVQQYDNRGQPTNLATRLHIRDYVRASNEVMQAAGITEDVSEIKAQELANDIRRWDENIKGLRRLDIGRLLLLTGVWGVLGLKRRVLLYSDHQSQGLFGVIRGESRTYSITQMLCFGLPSFLICRGVDWLRGYLADSTGSPVEKPQSLLASSPDSDPEKPTLASRVLSTTINVSCQYFALHFWIFAILQQLRIAPTSGILPSPWYLVPLTRFSPIRFSGSSSSSIGSRSYISLLSSVFLGLGPITVIAGYGIVNNLVRSRLFPHVYGLLPRPMNLFEAGSGDEENQQQHRASDSSQHQFNSQETSESNNDPGGFPAPPPVTSDSGSPRLSSHSPTLQALEGSIPILETTSAGVNDGSSDDENADPRPQPTLTFDTNSSEPPSTTPAGPWSAELRSFREPPSEIPVYNITALTMLPPLLAADGISNVLSSAIMFPAESFMIRMLWAMYTPSPTWMVPLWDPKLSWHMFTSVIGVHLLDLIATGLVWSVITPALASGSRMYGEEDSLASYTSYTDISDETGEN